MVLYFFNNVKNKLSNNSLFVFLFLMFASFSINAQSVVDNSSIENIKETTTSIEYKVSPKIEFAIWFMGTNQIPNALIVPESKNPKKQIMSSGVAPNRLLIESFLKKAVSFESSWG